MSWNPAGELAFHQNMGLGNFSFQSFVNVPTSEYSYEQQNSQESDVIQQRLNDEDFINKYVSSIQQRKQIESKGNCIKISEAKRILIEITMEKKKVENDVCGLDVSDEDFHSKWEALMSKMNEINMKISNFDDTIKTPLQKAIKKRLKKRKAMKEKRQKYQSLKKLAQKEIEEKHKMIDKLLSERSDEVEAVKREATLKRQADAVMHEVRKKKFEAKKMLNLLTALAKLRELRSKEEEKQGGYCSKQLTETFNKVMTRFQHLWEKQMEVYKLEEKGLKIMLEENSLPHVKESKFETNLLQWEKVLFGDITNDDNEKLLTLAGSDTQALIQVRQDWDQFLIKEPTPMASHIPPGWILPPETQDEQWKAFAKTPKKVSI